MKRTTLNAVVDALAFAGFVLLVATGVLMRWTLPPGSGRHLTVWGLGRHEWGVVHFWVSVALLAALAAHVALHWRWIVAVARRGDDHEVSRVRVALGLVALAALLALAMAPFLSPVERGARHGGPPGRHRVE